MELCKICPTCGTANSPTEMLCTRCFGDISGITPVTPPVTHAVVAADNAPPLRLLLPDGRQIELRSGDVAGRAGAGGELFREYAIISRNHARFEYSDGTWWVTDLNSTNGTFLEGKRLPSETPAALSNGQELRFGSGFRAVVSVG